MNSISDLASGRPRVVPTASERLGSSFILVAYAVLCLVSLAPFVMVANPPVVDFANHSARLFLACNLGDATVAQMYQYRLGIIPNLAVDLVNWPLCGVLAPGAVVKLVTVASLVLIYASGWLIQRKLFGRANAFLFLLPAIGLNLVTTMGYANYLAGVGVALLLVALAIGRERNFRVLVPICNAGGLVLFFCHIFSLAFAVVFFFGLMLGRSPRTAKGFVEAGLRTALLFALPLALVLFVPSEGQPLALNYTAKVRLLVATLMTQHDGLWLFAPVLLAPLYLLLRNRIAEVHPTMRVPLLALAAYVLIVPSGIQNAVDVDSRTLVAVAYLFFASMRPLRNEREATAGLAAFAAALAAFQIWAMVAIWQPFSREVAEFRQAARVLPRGAKVLSAMDVERHGRAYVLAYVHLASYATIDRLVFNPLEFTGIGMQPLSVTPRYAALDTPAALPFEPEALVKLARPDADVRNVAHGNNAEFAINWPDRFDYLVYYHFGRPRNPDPAILAEVERGSFFSIYKVAKGPPARTD